MADHSLVVVDRGNQPMKGRSASLSCTAIQPPSKESVVLQAERTALHVTSCSMQFNLGLSHDSVRACVARLPYTASNIHIYDNVTYIPQYRQSTDVNLCTQLLRVYAVQLREGCGGVPTTRQPCPLWQLTPGHLHCFIVASETRNLCVFCIFKYVFIVDRVNFVLFCVVSTRACDCLERLKDSSPK